MVQSSKQTCIILRIVRILSPTNNSALHEEREGGCKVHVAWWGCVCVPVSMSISACTEPSVIALECCCAHFVGIPDFYIHTHIYCQGRPACFVCACGVSVFLSVSPPRFRVNEAVYQRLAQLVGAGDKHLDPRTLGAIVNKRLVGSGGEWRRQLSSVNEPPCFSQELLTEIHTRCITNVCSTGPRPSLMWPSWVS